MKKRLVKISLYLFTAILVLLIGSCVLISKPKPEGISGPEAEALTDKMFEAIHKEAWDTTNIVLWTFFGHNYIWDKKNEWLQVSWGNQTVLMDLPSYTGEVFENGRQLNGRRKNKLFNRAYALFCNDSFWLIAPSKARDEGTSRFMVDLENGTQGLMVSYQSGGVTPGDTYLWHLDENGRPVGWQMWVKILPVKGLYSTWSDWTKLETGAWVATSHDTKGFSTQIENLRSGQTYKDLGMDNPFPFEK